jgi:hypothetical protein
MGSKTRTAALIAMCLAVGAAGGAHWAAQRVASEDDAARWPEEAPVALDLARPTLVLFVHPGSPDAQAALDEVARLEKRLDRRVAVSVRVYRPDGPIAGWEKNSIWKKASAISADVAADPEGDIARKFGVMPAESAVVYAPSGRRLFRGAVIARAGRGRAAFTQLTSLFEAWRGLESRPVVGVPGKV